jgi:aryl carrier-like protein
MLLSSRSRALHFPKPIKGPRKQRPFFTDIVMLTVEFSIRAAFIRDFQSDIDSYYDRVEHEEAQSGENLPEDEIRRLVRTTVADALQMPESDIKDDTDFFSLGLDSLMAISVRRKLSQEVNTNGKVLSSNIVFEKPNVDALTRFLFSMGNGVQEEKRPTEEVMQSLVEKYSTITHHVSRNVRVDGEYIVSDPVSLFFTFEMLIVCAIGTYWCNRISRCACTLNIS